MWPMYWCLWSQISFIASLVNIFYVDTKAGASLSPLQIHSKCQTSRAKGGGSGWSPISFANVYQMTRKKVFWLTASPVGPFPATSPARSPPAWRPPCTCPRSWWSSTPEPGPWTKRNYQGIVWKISGVVFLHRVVSDLVTLNLTRMAIWKRNIFV